MVAVLFFTYSENTEKYCVGVAPSDTPSTVKIDQLIKKLKCDTQTHTQTHTTLIS